jgi:hypothetical protein
VNWSALAMPLFPTTQELTAARQRIATRCRGVCFGGIGADAPADSATHKCALTRSKVPINPTCRHLESGVSAA